ncbi:MAG: hypothetical protein IAE98_03275 [Candidatus Kapabacteria bacterium]|nr:hypothetical protein [Candidatus Kapabacteria bacterium]
MPETLRHLIQATTRRKNVHSIPFTDYSQPATAAAPGSVDFLGDRRGTL